MTEFGERLRELRRKRGFNNQGKLADAVGVRQNQISQWENNVEPRYEMLVKLAEILKTTTDYLTGRTTVPEGTVDELSLYERDMIAWSRSLNRPPTTDDFKAYALDRHPDNPQLRRTRKTPKVSPK